jgi:AraC-like DNA-binding protein
MQSFNSDLLPVATRATDWNHLYSNQLNQVDFTPADRHAFAAKLGMGRLGPVQFVRMCASRSDIERTPRHIRTGAPRVYSYMLQVHGSSVLNHWGHEAHLTQGDLVLCDSTVPHRFTIDDDSTVIMLRVDAQTMREHLPTPEQYCGRRLRSDVGLTGTMSAMIEKLDTQLEGGFSSSYDARFARHLLEMLSMTYAIGFEAEPSISAVVRGRQAHIVRYIEENLRDPGLSPAQVAIGLNMSPRYLRTVFARSGEKLSAYIMRRRLEECAKQIRHPGWQGHTLTEIAFAWGFNSSAHFTRAFREQFSVTPREYRRNMTN